MNGRNQAGLFVRGNPWASQGGRARAERLTPQQRRAIARQGFAAFVERRFGGDREAAVSWLGTLGAWASDAPYRDRFPVFDHPGPCPMGRTDSENPHSHKRVCYANR